MGRFLTWLLASAAFLCVGTGEVQAVDWMRVAPKTVNLFYPGPTSFEFLLTQADHSGADKFKAGKSCKSCHGGEERASGLAMIAADKAAFPSVAQKPPMIPVEVRIAAEGPNLLIRASFNPGSQPDMAMDPDFDMKLAVMIGDAAVPEIARGGCFAACHDDAASMPKAIQPPITKYLGASRTAITRTGGGTSIAVEKVQAMANGGQGLDYWQARLRADGSLQVVDGQVLDKRQALTDGTITATAERQGETWVVTFTRPRASTNGRLALSPGHTYMIGFALHAGHAAKRFHYVSFDHTLALGSAADFSVSVP